MPSLGAVSQLRVLTRAHEADSAHEIRVSGDKIEPIAAAAGPPGTTVEVRELFFNVPARQKFLRTPQTEMGHITEQLARIALVHSEIEFRLTHNNRTVHQLRPATGMRSRIRDFYGSDLADGLLEIKREERGLKITGYAAPPAESRSSSKWQYLFLNGRYIRDRFVGHAIREAYRGLMEPSRYPVVFLSLEIDPAAVDVNVHPTKVEVRWRDSNMIYSQILSSLRDRFLNADLTPSLRTAMSGSHIEDNAPDTPATAVGQGAGEAESDTDATESPHRVRDVFVSLNTAAPGTDAETAARRERIRESIADFFKKTKPTIGGGSGPSLPSAAWGSRTTESPAPIQPASDWRTPESRSLGSIGLEPGLGQGASESRSRMSVIQVHRSYLVAETDDGLVIIDQHALHERVLYQQLTDQFSRGRLESQRLLLPETIDVSPDQVEIIESHADLLRQIGFELSAYGPNAIAVHAAPSLLKPERTAEFVRDMLDRLTDEKSPASTEMMTNDLLSMMACKAAVKAGDPLSHDEIDSLMQKRGEVERSSNCPHGRPTALRLTLSDLEKQFKRT
jgi:DNA mismatch repair protein MutL